MNCSVDGCSVIGCTMCVWWGWSSLFDTHGGLIRGRSWRGQFWRGRSEVCLGGAAASF